MPEIPDLSHHPTVEPVHFGEASGIAGLHMPPATADTPPPAKRARKPRNRSPRPAGRRRPAQVPTAPPQTPPDTEAEQDDVTIPGQQKED